MTQDLHQKVRSAVYRSYPELQRHLQWMGQPLNETQVKIVLEHEAALLEMALEVFREARMNQMMGDRDLASLFEKATT